MSPIHRDPRRAFPGIPLILCALLMCVLWTSCATCLRPTKTDAAGNVPVVVTFDGTIKVDPNPVKACFFGLFCSPPANRIQWNIVGPPGARLDVKVNAEAGGQPCKSLPKIPYKRNPGFERISCTGSQCVTVGKPVETGCYKYDVTVTPSTGAPVTLDPDMIIM